MKIFLDKHWSAIHISWTHDIIIQMYSRFLCHDNYQRRPNESTYQSICLHCRKTLHSRVLLSRLCCLQFIRRFIISGHYIRRFFPYILAFKISTNSANFAKSSTEDCIFPKIFIDSRSMCFRENSNYKFQPWLLIRETSISRKLTKIKGRRITWPL